MGGGKGKTRKEARGILPERKGSWGKSSAFLVLPKGTSRLRLKTAGGDMEKGNVV